MPLDLTDVTDTTAPKSDQLDAVDLLSGARIFRVEAVSEGPADQPLQVHLAGFPRPWRPGVSMRRVLVAAWGKNAQAWVGRHVELFCNPDVMFGKDKVGGTRISRMSHLDRTLAVPLLVAKGRSATYTVDPIPETEARVAVLRGEWQAADPDHRKAIEAEVAQIQGGRS
jgi:hypothetical protein